MSVTRPRAVQTATILVLVGGGALTALASIVGVGGDAVELTLDNVCQDQNESDTEIRAFDENQCITLKNDLVTDQGVIPAGTAVSCHIARSDPDSPPTTLQGGMLFDAPILGVISSSAGLNASDDPCGLDTTTYCQEAFRGLEAGQADAYQLVSDCGLKVRMEVTEFQDQARIITECCPEGEECCEG
jgi:hypothetical protein